MFRRIAIGTLLAASLDILEVIVFYAMRGVAAPRVLQGVAAGVLGRESFSRGATSALLGLAIHFFIAFVVVTIYHLASRRIATLTRHPLLCGAAYGLLVFAVMTYVVVPMSASGGGAPKNPLVLANLLFAHIVCVGMATGWSAVAGRDARVPALP
ncbi:MAG TPA: hypothetical protein VF698_06710 [Thermoanaerobaculia bacterium]|jgi:hypothetical protein